MGEMTADGRQVKNTDRAVPARCHFLRSGSRTAFLCVDGHNESSMVDFDEINLWFAYWYDGTYQMVYVMTRL